MLALNYFLKAAYCFGKRNVATGNTCEFFRYVKGLGEKSLDLSCSLDECFVIVGKLIHTHYCYDIHKLLISLQNSLHLARYSVVLLTENFGGEDTAC